MGRFLWENYKNIGYWVYFVLRKHSRFLCWNCGKSVTRQFQSKNKNEKLCFGRSSTSTCVLPQATFLRRLWRIHPPDRPGSSRPAFQTGLAIIACQSCRLPCFSLLLPHTWQETHIYTQKWNYRQFEERGSFGSSGCYWAFFFVETMNSSHPWLCIKAEQREERERKKERWERNRLHREFCLGLMTSCHSYHFLSAILPLLLTYHFSFSFCVPWYSQLPLFALTNHTNGV